VDFACWCTYKYLNAGPGNIAGAFVHERHFPALSTAIDTANDARVGAEHALATAIPTLRGWWGHHRASRFSLHRNFVPSVGAAVLQMSNPGVLGMMALAPALSLMARIGIENLRAKSLQLTHYMESLLVSHYAHALRLLTPTDPERRGAMLTLELLPGALRRELAATLHTSAYENGTASNANDADLLQRLLLERGHVMTDCRPPNIVRITPVPLYNSFEDVWVLCDLLGQLLKTKEEMVASSSK
jgi:kynureninase